jgi:hypothetical protein
VYIFDLENKTVIGTIALPTTGYTTCAIDDVNGLAYIFQRTSYPNTKENYNFIVYDYVNDSVVSTKKTTRAFGAVQACDFIDGKIFVLYGLGTTAVPNGYVVFNTNGGDLRAGLNIYDFITARKDVTTVALKAYSMGSLLFVAGKKRIMFPHSDLMIHEPLLSSGVSGSCSEILTVSDHLKDERERLIQLYVQHTRMTTAYIRKFMKKDTYLTPDQARSSGFAMPS